MGFWLESGWNVVRRAVTELQAEASGKAFRVILFQGRERWAGAESPTQGGAVGFWLESGWNVVRRAVTELQAEASGKAFRVILFQGRERWP